jgi:hypothetical protein
LDAPTILVPIKDAQLLVYQVELIATGASGDANPVWLFLTADDVEQIFDGSPLNPYQSRAKDSQWAQAQRDRSLIYERWIEILITHEIDLRDYPSLIQLAAVKYDSESSMTCLTPTHPDLFVLMTCPPEVVPETFIPAAQHAAGLT